MDTKLPEAKTQAPHESPKDAPTRTARRTTPSIVVAAVVAAIVGLSVWYLVRGQPLLVQGEVDATRFDMAARVDGRVARDPR
jgi:HlyD family secretion protein